MIWGNGLMAKWGVLDFAGGIVVHATAGFAALASVIYVGKRRQKHERPNNLPLVAIGTALLWFGWYGFNAGSELQVNGVTALSFINTDLAASVGAVTWLVIEWTTGPKRPTFVGLLTGSVAGLATITPAAGYVTYATAFFIGIAGSVVCYWAVKLKNKMEWDDALDVWGVHGMGGVTGTVLLGVFATRSVNSGGSEGLLSGNWHFFMKEFIAVVATSVYAFLFTYLMLMLINKITRVKVTAEEEELGLDFVYHGEIARDLH
jgi:ammonium transporter, Amt family